KSNTTMQVVPKKRLDQLSDGKHQGMVAFVAAYEYASVDMILQRAEAEQVASLILILDERGDAHNLGAILRTADGKGGPGVIVPKSSAGGWTETLALAAARW